MATKPALCEFIAHASVEALIESLIRVALAVDVQEFVHAEAPDPKDIYLLDAVVSGGADCLITSAKPLLRVVAPPQGVAIVTPAEFLHIVWEIRDGRW